MSNKQIRTPQVTQKIKKSPKKKLSKKALLIICICVASAIVLAAGSFITVSLLNRFSPATADKHLPMNALPEVLSSTVVFKDGGLYLANGASTVLVDEKVYNPSDKDALSALTYLWDPSDNTLIYLSDPDGERKLIKYRNGETKFLVQNVSAWRISPDRTKIAAVIDAGETGLGGTLLMIENGKNTLLEYNVKAETIYFTEDSSALFAQTGNGNFGELHMFKDGESNIVDSSIFAMGWLAPDGSSYLSVEVSETAYVYNYTLKTLSGKNVSFKNVTFSDASPDGSIMYILHDYDTTAGLGTLSAVDTKTLKTHRIADNVYAFNQKAVTDTSKGMVYASKGTIQDRCNIFYFDVASCKSISIAQNAYSSTIGSIAINSGKNSGYLLLMGNTKERSQLYAISFQDGKMNSEKLTEGAIYEIVYYEACDRITYSTNGDTNKVELYGIGSDHKSEKLLNNCGAIYDSSSSAYYACSILSNDNKYLVYLKNTVIIDETDGDQFASHPNADIYGTLMLRNNATGDLTVISTNVLADSFDCIQVDSAAQNIFFSVLTKDGKFDIYHYDTSSGQKTLLLSGADAMANYQ